MNNSNTTTTTTTASKSSFFFYCWIILLHLTSTSAFVINTFPPPPPPPPLHTSKTRRQISALHSATNNNNSNNNNININTQPRDNILILPSNLLFKNGLQRQISSSIKLARELWSDVDEYLDLLGDVSWLENKMEALGRVCYVFDESVLLVKLLVDEQRLDNQQSVGKKGKYSQKFHPRKLDDHRQLLSSNIGSTNGSRPLTVGEVDVNWDEDFVQVLEMRYRIKDTNEPLRTFIRRLKEEEEDLNLLPNTCYIDDEAIDHDVLASMLDYTDSHSSCHVYVLLTGSRSDTVQLQNMITSECVTFIECPADMNECSSTSQINKIQDIIYSCSSDDASVKVVHCSLDYLIRAKDRLIDYNSGSPTQFGTRVRLEDTSEITLSLLLASWSNYNGPNENDTAVMNPWLGVMEKPNFLSTMRGSPSAFQSKKRN